MFESLASCFAFRCSASLNMTLRLSVLPEPHSVRAARGAQETETCGEEKRSEQQKCFHGDLIAKSIFFQLRPASATRRRVLRSFAVKPDRERCDYFRSSQV